MDDWNVELRKEKKRKKYRILCNIKFIETNR